MELYVWTGNTLLPPLGLLAFLAPWAGIVVFTFGGVSADDMTGKELSMFRMVGGATLFIGYYYAQSARAPRPSPPQVFCSTSRRLSAQTLAGVCLPTSL